MPRNRRLQDRETKSAEIISAAARLFAEEGYENTTMASVARAAGVTTTTIYWYVEDKEALLVAVLDHLLGVLMEGLQEHADDAPTDRLLWVVEELRQRRKVVTTVHALAETSRTVAQWHDAFHELTNAMLADELRLLGVPEEHVPATTRLGVFAVEGLLVHDLPREEQRAVLELLSARD